jgi:hypothetical protein
MNRWDIFERLVASVLAVLQPFIIYFCYGDMHSISQVWGTTLQPMFIIVNALVSFFFFKLEKWKIPALLLLLLTAFPVTNYFILHNIIAVSFFIFSGISLWSIKRFRLYILVYLVSCLFLFDGLFWAETWAIITLVFYHIHLMLHTLLIIRNRPNSL